MFNRPHSSAQRNTKGTYSSSELSPSARDRARALLVVVAILASATFAASLMLHQTGGAAVAVAVLTLVAIAGLVVRINTASRSRTDGGNLAGSPDGDLG